MLTVDHIVFPVWDAEKSLHFYRDVMEFALIQSLSGPDWGGYPWLMMIFSPGDGREIVLVALRGAKRPKKDGLARDVRHLAFGERSVAALAGWRKKLKASGVEFWQESHGRQRSIYFEDPNGVVIEITAPPGKARGRTRHEAVAFAERWMSA